MGKEVRTSGGLGFFSLLGVAFIVLKLCKVITWSWWWVTAPIWGPIALVVAIFMIGLLFIGLGYLFSSKK